LSLKIGDGFLGLAQLFHKSHRERYDDPEAEVVVLPRIQWHRGTDHLCGASGSGLGSCSSCRLPASNKEPLRDFQQFFEHPWIYAAQSGLGEMTKYGTAEVLSRKHLAKDHIARLSERFHVSPELFSRDGYDCDNRAQTAIVLGDGND
jgi:hypothetical protein